MAGEGDAERLVVLLEARIRDFEKNMAKASGTATRDFKKMRQQSRSATRQMEADMLRSTSRVNQALAITSTRMGSLARSGLGGLTAGFISAAAPILSVAAALNTAKQAMQEFDNLGNKAKMFGVDVERLQELRFAAEQSGMAVDNFDTALRRFIRRSAEAAQGTGAAKSAFKELGIELHDNTGRLKDSHQLLGEVADALQRVPNQADKLRLAFKMFDTDGAAMVNVLSDGVAGLDAFAEKARSLGLVVDRDLIARAQEMKADFDTASKVIDLNFKQALINLAPILTHTAQLVGGVAQAVNILVDQFRDIEDRTLIRPMQNRLAGLYEQRAFLQEELTKLETGFNIPVISDHALNSVKNKLSDIDAEAMALLTRITELQGTGVTKTSLQLPELPKLPSSDKPSDAAKLLIKQAEAVAALETAATGALQTIVDGFLDGRDAADVFGNALRDVGKQLIAMGIGGLFGGGGGDLGLIGALFGGGKSLKLGYQFAEGGYTGPGGKNQPAGVVHKGEVVWSQRDVAKAGGVGVVEAMRRGVGGYADGGVVAMPRLPSIPAPANSNRAPSFTFAPAITMSDGSPESIARLERSVQKMQTEFEGRVRKIVARRGKDMW